ncbi:ABC transporter ATP-binding protein [Chitinimonas sp. BJB300]|uniref:ABC transporter ATP-binding protein n=1 Tax=Chitinimonas sp. BJB300 TaxID=1559339 RepID=UPI000C0E833E|nr:ABC transporter ATP-binding protein [Chitinimonas sp. BJB300]PHV12410.1 iron ABC transporter ATP-binding protein [Chitinimonas sp. BJB300]TSJ89008.1 ABC transporter ATP-binding protein [Chitinimonas sp. BJB300]
MNAPHSLLLPAFQLRQLGFQAGKRNLLAQINTELPRGQFTAIVGPNGAGKSTLLKLLGGLLTGHQGQILLDGIPLSTLPLDERARKLGWQGQFPPNELPLNLADYVLLGRRPNLGSFGRASSVDLARVMDALKSVELQDRHTSPWRNLSGGERQRAGLARLLTQDAPIWLLDEPINHLDLKHQALLFRRLRSEVAKGRTIIAVLHDLTQAARWADHVLLLGDGQLLAQGEPTRCLEPASLSQAYQWPVRLWQNQEGHWQVAVGEAA